MPHIAHQIPAESPFRVPPENSVADRLAFPDKPLDWQPQESSVQIQAQLQAGDVWLKSSQVFRRKEHQQLQQLVLENDFVGALRTCDDIVLWVNPAFAAMLGFGAHECVAGAGFLNHVSKSTFRAWIAAAAPTWARGGIYGAFVELLSKAGMPKWVELNAIRMDPDTNDILWTFIDLSNSHDAEQAMLQQIKYRRALNEVAKCIIENDHGSILRETASIIGTTLGLDCVGIFQVALHNCQVSELCMWWHPQGMPQSQRGSARLPTTLPDAAVQKLKAGQYLASQITAPNPHLVDDRTRRSVHDDLQLASLVWFPFDLNDEAINFLALHQTASTREFNHAELQFLESVGHQINMALTKIQLLHAREASQEKLELAASVFTHTREAIVITEPNGTIINVNDAFCRITGFSREEAIGSNPRILNSGRQTAEFYAHMWNQLAERGYWFGELWNQRKNGEIYAELLTISAVYDANRSIKHFIGLFTDITAFKEHESELEHIAHYDALTNLPNRVLLLDRLQQGMVQEQRRGKKLVVVFIDLDGFKAINDNFGHAVGDQLLIAVAAQMKQSLRDGDTLARIGGDEFVAVLGELDDVNASTPMLTRLINAAARPIVIDGEQIQVSASLGVTHFPQEQDIEADQLLRQSDQAMYQAKLAGKGRFVFFDAEQDSGIRSFHESVERIRQGLANGEFVLHYQPKVNMATGEVLGAEALIRWQHPEDGLLSPGAFLPTIENHPIAIEMGEWVIQAALSQMQDWQSQGMDIAVSVNAGARQLQMPGFVDRLQEALAMYPGVKPGNLEIEILETGALVDLSRMAQVIEECREMGVLFAMDDFGTGYSSLTYLRRLKVNWLKIDQSFVRGMLDNMEDFTILQGIIGLAKSFSRIAIAEGVETEAHGTLLLQLGCEIAQGYGIAKPMAAHLFPTWMQSWKPSAKWEGQSVVAAENMPLLYACIEHRAWFDTVRGYLHGERQTPPVTDPLRCSFGEWLHRTRQYPDHRSDRLAALCRLHDTVHASGAEIVALHWSGNHAGALNKLPELGVLCSQLVLEFESLALDAV